ncbi:AC9 transposase [Canna indica]|uniref:AC9 transposase n=1 Tax=Canna indica TaxID=4628 RepID=A0AAQ3JYJ7_9LILI|nr:AC9 transposase [Canna indica]
MVSRNTIKSDIMKIYNVEKNKLQHMLEKVESRIAITTDMWTSNQKKGYMFVYVPAPHTVDVLAEKMIESLTQWNIETKMSTITVDNCSSNDGMIRFVQEKLSNESLLQGKFLHMRCCAHILNLIVKDGLSVIEDPRYKFRIVEYYYPTIYGDNAYLEIENVRRTLYDLLHEYQSRVINSQSLTSQVSHAQHTDMVDDVDENLHDFLESSGDVVVKSEIDQYLDDGRLPLTRDFDILSWWKSNGLKYPTLQRIARDFLAIPISTVASEAAFSTTQGNNEQCCCKAAMTRKLMEVVASPPCATVGCNLVTLLLGVAVTRGGRWGAVAGAA